MRFLLKNKHTSGLAEMTYDNEKQALIAFGTHLGRESGLVYTDIPVSWDRSTYMIAYPRHKDPFLYAKLVLTMVND